VPSSCGAPLRPLKAHGGKLLGASLVALAASTFAIVRGDAPSPVVTSLPANVETVAPVETPAAPTEALVSPHQLPEAPVAAAAMPSMPAATTPETSVRKFDGVRGPTSRSAAVVDEPPSQQRPISADSLGAEMRLVREARNALKAGNLTLTRRNIDEHARSFPDGAFREERLVLGVLLLCAEGHVERARRAADELAAAHPHSSHLDALRDSCAGSSTSAKPRSGD
jgi:hypothetical protein